jgi:uncharacterized Zn finger protein
MGYRRYYGFPRYVSVGEKRAKAQHKLKQLQKKNPGIQPIVIDGNKLAHTWWGKAWNKNLECYADYSNRIGRGRSYVRHGAVLDLKIKPGKVDALVQGARRSPYKVEIKIKSISKASWKKLKQDSAGELASLQELLDGRFPKALNEIFTAKGKGLFPSPAEIDFKCSCPDWAYMCKHVAATLYGIGTRLDEDPGLFFVLRKAKVEDLITEAVQEKSKKLLKQAQRKTSRVMEDTDLADVFGIEIEDAAAMEKPKRTIKKKKRKAVASKTKRKVRNKVAKKKVVKKKVKKKIVKKNALKKKVKKTAKKTVVKKKTVKKKVKKKSRMKR